MVTFALSVHKHIKIVDGVRLELAAKDSNKTSSTKKQTRVSRPTKKNVIERMTRKEQYNGL